MKKISVVIPMYYEEEVANECYNRMKKNLNELSQYDYEIIFVNDGSKDKTLEILQDIAKQDKKVKIVSFSRNFGHQAAVTAGLKYITGDCGIIIDADIIHQKIICEYKIMHINHADFCLVKCYHICGIFYLKVL